MMLRLTAAAILGCWSWKARFKPPKFQAKPDKRPNDCLPQIPYQCPRSEFQDYLKKC
jgi:hypothetical protein